MAHRNAALFVLSKPLVFTGTARKREDGKA
jgi:hypothetical protein